MAVPGAHDYTFGGHKERQKSMGHSGQFFSLFFFD